MGGRIPTVSHAALLQGMRQWRAKMPAVQPNGVGLGPSLWTWNPMFRVGDIVTRGGDDRQRILDVREGGQMITVRCIKAPASGWCELGEEESNLARRYQYPEALTVEPGLGASQASIIPA